MNRMNRKKIKSVILTESDRSEIIYLHNNGKYLEKDLLTIEELYNLVINKKNNRKTKDSREAPDRGTACSEKCFQ